ncbi:hypothetical protein K461DRAFT_18530 [Myriangium duriaei CBS 260.36]|uniref:Uncharacterized protein n=1 Tax=Myriangium duriaei CBS 260.36 TaxID=1168546 RepID=A0A9P4JB86_9PEZI|nr:hypothetical protein K461DRAFT_18530 [Myriangium duriaei CBS 260.36]
MRMMLHIRAAKPWLGLDISDALSRCTAMQGRGRLYSDGASMLRRVQRRSIGDSGGWWGRRRQNSCRFLPSNCPSPAAIGWVGRFRKAIRRRPTGTNKNRRRRGSNQMPNNERGTLYLTLYPCACPRHLFFFHLSPFRPFDSLSSLLPPAVLGAFRRSLAVAFSRVRHSASGT